jgi:uncharacterized membrane protein ArfC
MPDWLWILLLVVVVLVVLIVISWWWTHRRPKVAASAPRVASASGPYGAGSAAPLADGSAPAGFTIKGNADSMLYHTPASPYYGRTKAEAWFATEADAARAGFTRWDANKPA